MSERPICEPVELPIGTSVVAERVSTPATAGPSGHFIHFHDVAELVLFGDVSGEFIADGCRHELSGGALVFIPSMRHHDFVLGPGAKQWVLVQLDPYIVESFAATWQLGCFHRPFCAEPDAQMRTRIEAVAGWLVEAAADPGDPAISALLELLLLLVARAPRMQPDETAGAASQVDRLLPALESLRSRPGDPLELPAAAAMCRLSPTYFSRRFRQMLGLGFSDYVRTYRLHLAARRIVTSGAAISEIAYGVGFRSPAHFSARFAERFGMTPREYRNRARQRVAIEGEG